MPRRDLRPQEKPAPLANRTAARRAPRVGDHVYIVHLAARERGTITAVHDEGRRVEVRGEEEEAILEFVLSRTSARFVSGGAHGPRLRWATSEEGWNPPEAS